MSQRSPTLGRNKSGPLINICRASSRISLTQAESDITGLLWLRPIQHTIKSSWSQGATEGTLAGHLLIYSVEHLLEAELLNFLKWFPPTVRNNGVPLAIFLCVYHLFAIQLVLRFCLSFCLSIVGLNYFYLSSCAKFLTSLYLIISFPSVKIPGFSQKPLSLSCRSLTWTHVLMGSSTCADSIIHGNAATFISDP